MIAMTSSLNRPTDRLPEMVRVAITRVKKGASYLSDEERRIFDGYDGPVVAGAADVQESSARPNLQKKPNHEATQATSQLPWPIFCVLSLVFWLLFGLNGRCMRGLTGPISCLSVVRLWPRGALLSRGRFSRAATFRF